MSPQSRRLPHAWWTVLLILAAVAFIFTCSASFGGAFESAVPVTVMSERSGLVMESGAKVKMLGVQVGHVGGDVL